ncbi:MAG: hypothetical protein O3A20_01960 [Planctomycetota bacterium]|nr:hypothetical protein [Planctomycetota bacterium]
MVLDLKTAEMLTSPEARETMALFRNSSEDPLAIQESFRGMFPEKIARALGELRALRRRAMQKFARGSDMYFTKPQLEQASSEPVALYRAPRFLAAGETMVHDPCCGIGSDTIAMARAGLQVEAADRDPVALHFAAANAEVNEMSAQIRFREADCELEAPPPGGAIFLDPARRRGSRRIIRPEEWSPGPDAVRRALEGRSSAALKLSPAVDIAELLEHFPAPDEIEILSFLGEAKETVFWYGKAAGKEARRATILPSGDTYAGVEHAQAENGELQEWIYDPDPALVRAGLLGAFAAQHGLVTIDPQIAYLTGPKRVDSPFVDTFRVLNCEALDPRKMRAMLREHQAGELAIRKRGIAERPQTLSQRFLPKKFGDRRLTLIATRIGDRHIGILSEFVQG